MGVQLRIGMNQSLPISGITASSIDGELLWGFWYPALRSDELRGRALVTAMRMEIPLVLGRDAAGKAFALRDVCPHRAFPLSAGSCDGQTVECTYHGWRFDAHTGQCREIPSITADSKLQCDRIYAGSFPCEERDGYIWVYLANPEGRAIDRSGIAPVPELPKFSGHYRIAHLTADLTCTMDTGIVGLMDPAHGPFVHQAWWWRSRRSIREKQKTFEPIPNGFRMSSHAPSANSGPYKLLRFYGEEVTTQIDFVLPNVRTEQVRCGARWFTNRTTVTPIRRDLCRLDFVAAWNLFPWFPVTPFLRFFGKRFIGQDQQVIERQQPGLKVQPRMMLIDDADRQARWYFQLKAAYLAAQQTGAPMAHPLDGPVTLRWRS
ncbi:MAG: aromatic ring-hydroxylating dioxygenase subunit alpha [Candidatus Acidiferrales bacterium]|jgi:phenylpropionate dioxygenase-like ring-hydroxylating dioxygenase large terminal subunit